MANKKSKKKKKVKINKILPKATIEELYNSRDGGQIALKGYTYQYLYSCYLILSELDSNTVFYLEGIEDIDKLKYNNSSANITYVQLKYSINKQDASFFKDIMKNFLEAYLLDKNSDFNLIYDFPITVGNMSKLFSGNLDEKSTIYWKRVAEEIETENPLWNWTDFSFKDFIEKINFKEIDRNTLTGEIEKILIENYGINTDNISLFANGIKVCCLEKMEKRDSINKEELDILIQNIKDDISKGIHNPAHGWIKTIDFDEVDFNTDLSYYEGKKSTPQDIVQKLPVRRFQLESEIKESIQNNRVTVIKASSGQGKTTLALQVAFELKKDYKLYKLTWCNDSKELNNIVQIFRTRIMLGEKPLIIIDNLDSQLIEWNRLAQLLQEEVPYNYKLLITTREDDWYNYSGDLSNIKALQVIKISLNEKEAQEIFDVLKDAKKLHKSVLDWRKCWNKVAGKKLLIEYIYLLTHGEMLAERISHQIIEINNTETGRIKCDILRKICFADICGIRLSVRKLVASLTESSNMDYGELLKSIENEFLIRIDESEKYVEGLHPVRSQHIIDKLHEFIEINETALQVIKISDSCYFSKLFSNLPNLIFNAKQDFYSKTIDILWNTNDLSFLVLALQGIFSGSILEYFLQNKDAYDNANEHGGLLFFDTELNPFSEFKEFKYSVSALDKLKDIMPENNNIQYLCNLRDGTSKIVMYETDIYIFCTSLFNKIKDYEPFDIITDINSYSIIAYWLINIEPNYNLSKKISLDKLWCFPNKYSVEVISSIMYTCFCGNKDYYMNYVKENLSDILLYLKEATRSIKVYVGANKSDIHVEYILLPSDIIKGNEESVSRLNIICKMLPIFKIYCADSTKPNVEILSGYKIPNDSHKTIPIENLIITFHQDFNSLWGKTIMSRYECDSIFDWLEHWFSVRNDIVTISDKIYVFICKLLEFKAPRNLADEIDGLRFQISKNLKKEYRFPNEDRPFEEKAKMPEGFSEVKSGYFQSVNNFLNQLAAFLTKDVKNTRLALINLRKALSDLEKMQKFFLIITEEQEVFCKQHYNLCIKEEEKLQNLMIACLYFKEHQPSLYFTNYQIKSWYNQNYKEKIKFAQQTLHNLLTKNIVVFPQKYYYDGILSFYPIIVNDLNIQDSTILMEFLYNCTSFAELDYDYLVVACKNGDNKISPSGLKIPKDFLIKYKIAIDENDASLIEKLTFPFPEEINQKFLDCFEGKYEILKPIVTGYEGIDKVAELLWAFSMYHKELNNEYDSKYKNFIETKIKTEILDFLSHIKKQISQRDFNELLQLCNDVFKGKAFNDTNLNIFYSNMINKLLK